jgi:putative DNA primase/helicase
MADEYTPDELAFYRGILERFAGEKHIKSETDTDVLCPAHDDTRPSLGVDLRQNGKGPEVKIHCRSRGCSNDEILDRVGLTWKDLFFLRNGSHGRDRKIEVPGCTLEEYAAYKNLPAEFLAGEEGHPIALQDATWGGKPAVAIPYMDQDGNLLMRRFRTGLHKTEPDTRMRSEKGAKITAPYGLNWLDIAQEAGYVLIVEGESDCHVLWYHGLPALGIPGAKNWKDEWSSHLDGIETVLVAVEPDDAGESMWSKLMASTELYPRLEKVRFSDAF